MFAPFAKRSLLFWVGFAAAVAVFAAALSVTAAPKEMAPDFAAADLSGKKVRLSDFRGKKAVVVSFFATWCPPCREEMPHLQKLSRKYAGKNVAFLAVSVDAPGTDLKPFAKQYGLKFPVLHDVKGEAAKAYDVNAIPLLVIVDKKGRIMYRKEGFSPGMEKEVSKEIDAALAAR